MDHVKSHGSDFQQYPHLNNEEFTEVCHNLDRRYRQATLGPLRRKWRLNVCTALDTLFSFGAEYNTYVQIVRPLEGELDHGDLSTFLDNFSFGANDRLSDMPITSEDQDMMEAEESDQVRIFKEQGQSKHSNT